jgi:cell division protease FtsH
MSKAKNILQMLNETRERELVQYSSRGNSAQATTTTVGKLEAGVYNIEATMTGIQFEKHSINTDKLLRFKDSRYEAVLKEIEEFWNIGEDFQDLDFTHKRGVLLFGAPGTGKSCLLKLVIESITKERGDIVFLCRRPGLLIEGLRQFREVEPDRKALVILEDVDQMCYDDQALTELFDGDKQINGVLFLGTTNYLERMSARMLRDGRFDRKLEVKNPPKEGRKAYLEAKLGNHKRKDLIPELTEKTDGFSFAQMRELLVSVCCYKYDVDSSIDRIRNGIDEAKVSDEELETKLNSISLNENKAAKLMKEFR